MSILTAARWLIMRYALCFAEGIICTASLIIGVAAAVRGDDVEAAILAGLSGLIPGAFITGIREFMSETQDPGISDESNLIEKYPRWLQTLVVSLASGLLFALGAAAPLLAVKLTVQYCGHVRLVAMVSASSLGLLGFGRLSRFPSVKSGPQTQSNEYNNSLMKVMSSLVTRALLGGWIAIGVSFVSANYWFKKAS